MESCVFLGAGDKVQLKSLWAVMAYHHLWGKGSGTLNDHGTLEHLMACISLCRKSWSFTSHTYVLLMVRWDNLDSRKVTELPNMSWFYLFLFVYQPQEDSCFLHTTHHHRQQLQQYSLGYNFSSGIDFLLSIACLQGHGCRLLLAMTTTCFLNEIGKLSLVQTALSYCHGYINVKVTMSKAKSSFLCRHIG